MTLKILMVDDEPDAEQLFRQNFRREIRKDEYRFLFAQSAQAALDMLGADEAPGVLVVLSDINMPGMTGIELLETVKLTWPDLPVIMITAYGDAGTESSARSKGAHRLVSKPVDFEHLRSVLSGLTSEARG